MQAHLAAMRDEMLDVIVEGPLVIMKVNPAAREVSAPAHILKSKMEWATEDRKWNNLDNVAREILFKVVDDTIFSRIHSGKTIKEVWDSLMKIRDGYNKQKDNKLTMAIKKFENFKALPEESITNMEARFRNLLQRC